MSWCFDSYIYIYQSSKPPSHIWSNMNLITSFPADCLHINHPFTGDFFGCKASVTSRFSHMCSPSPTRSAANCCGSLMFLGTYFEDKIWVQVCQNGSLVATSFQLMIFHAWWFSCQEGVEFRGSAASKTSEHPMFKAFDTMQETDLWLIHDINRDRIRFWDPCWSSTKGCYIKSLRSM